MLFEYAPAVAMATGLMVYARSLQMAKATLSGTIAWHELTRAADFGLFITILAAPWFVLSAVLLI